MNKQMTLGQYRAIDIAMLSGALICTQFPGHCHLN